MNMMSRDFVWPTAAPENQGLSAAKLDALRDDLAARRTKTLLVVRHDQIIYEWYAPGYGPHVRHYTASLAKALVGGVSLMLALNDGRLGIDDAAWLYIPAWKNDPAKRKITIRHLATHSSGIEDATTAGKGHLDQGGWKADFWRQAWRDWGHDSADTGESGGTTTQAGDLDNPFSVALYQAPVIFAPGTQYAYSNPGMAALAYAVTASLRGAPQSDIYALLKQRIMDPIGVPEDDWFIGYGKGYEMDGLKLYANWGGGEYTARAVARVGRLMLRKGNWEGMQLVDPAWVEQSVAYAGTPIPGRPFGNPQPGSGLGWWTNFDGVWAKVPRDAFAGAGAGNQILLVVPSLDLIVVRNGELLGDAAEGEGFWGGLEEYLFDPLMDAIVGPPCSASKVIQTIEFAPASSITRQARGIPWSDHPDRFDGSDNWPLTWADDDDQYTAYGDGYGFAPYTEKKLSLGFARIVGPPAEFRGINIRSDSGERLGPGAQGAKASGMLMVEGVLYMWVRNTGNAQLAWSGDHGQNWTWSDWRLDTSFGCPTFLNFGKNYAGARDEYVYVYSPDAEDAYTPATHLVLARVPKGRIISRDAYVFFQRLDAAGSPVWTDDVQRRGGVFTFPGRCYRCSVTHNAGLGRYLLCQTLPGGDTRFEGGFGIYDGPEPWGPWTTVFFTEKWDIGPGETSSFPTKWMSPDGKTCYMVFSGDDTFSVRQAIFRLGESGVRI
jgi:CubicO group peptidase (beta-lactamase class C family)